MTTDLDRTTLMLDARVTLPLRLDGDPLLRRKAKPIAAVTSELRLFAEQMLVSMLASNGVGLAAPQVGRSIRMITLNTAMSDRAESGTLSPGEILLVPRMPLVLVNPELIAFAREMEIGNEGCLSIPKIYADVARPQRVVLKAATLDGQMFEVECAGLLGRCVQHEVDHLDGILFVDRLTKAEYQKIAQEVTALEARTCRERS